MGILFARIGWGERYQGENLSGNFREPNRSGSWWERFNFTIGPGNRCYGYVPPMGPYSSPPNPPQKSDWLVILCSKTAPPDALTPVGWYEHATFEDGNTPRPRHPTLRRSLQPLWNKIEYSFSTKATDAYLIPVGNRQVFPAIPTSHFRRPYIYAESGGSEHYPDLARVAESIVALRRHAKCVGKPRVTVRDLRKMLDKATLDLQESENLTCEEARKRIMASILQRPGQAQFRQRLLRAYRGECSISECDCRDALEAAHIHPFWEGGKDHETNGLLLRADLHRLFDLGKISIDPANRTVIISDELKGTVYEDLQGKRLKHPSNPAHKPRSEFLQKHRKAAGL